jgi:hypothetical protein
MQWCACRVCGEGRSLLERDILADLKEVRMTVLKHVHRVFQTTPVQSLGRGHLCLLSWDLG